jgi:hypothetical protein
MNSYHKVFRLNKFILPIFFTISLGLFTTNAQNDRIEFDFIGELQDGRAKVQKDGLRGLNRWRGKSSA